MTPTEFTDALKLLDCEWLGKTPKEFVTKRGLNERTARRWFYHDHVPKWAEDLVRARAGPAYDARAKAWGVWLEQNGKHLLES